MARPLSYQKVLLAIYILADDEGYQCWEPVEVIARQAGVSTSTVCRRLNELHEDGVINIRGLRARWCCGSLIPRFLMMMDNPRAVAFVEGVREFNAGKAAREREIAKG